MAVPAWARRRHVMIPIYIFEGPERYLLVRNGTTLGHDDARAERVAPDRARAVLEAGLRRRDRSLIQGLSAHLHMHDEDPEQVASQVLARLSATGGIGGDLV